MELPQNVQVLHVLTRMSLPGNSFFSSFKPGGQKVQCMRVGWNLKGSQKAPSADRLIVISDLVPPPSPLNIIPSEQSYRLQLQ